MISIISDALIIGVMISALAGPLGSIVVWRRMSFFGDSLAHSTMLGIAISLFFSINPVYGIFITPLIIALILLMTSNSKWLSVDTWLAIASHGTLAIGLVALYFVQGKYFNINAILFGDILAATPTDFYLLAGVVLFALAAMVWYWNDIIAVIISEDLAVAYGININLIKGIFLVLIAIFVAVSIKIVGVLLVTAIMIIPAATARKLSKSPEQMAIKAFIFGVIGVGIGTYLSVEFDTPTTPTIVCANLLLLILVSFYSLALPPTSKRAATVA